MVRSLLSTFDLVYNSAHLSMCFVVFGEEAIDVFECETFGFGELL